MKRSRSLWKIPYISSTFFQKRFEKNKNFKVRQRYSLIPSTFINKRLQVYNGTWHKSCDVTTDMIGHKFGEFSFTKNSEGQIRTKGKSKKKSNKKK